MKRPNFWNFKSEKNRISRLYGNPDKLVVIEFGNRTNIKKYIWVEPTCVLIGLEADTEYQVITHDRTFRIEFDKEETIVFYLQNSFGFILNKRPSSTEVRNPSPWTLDVDFSEIS